MLILAIESSCDETAAAVCEERKILSSVINTQIEEHKNIVTEYDEYNKGKLEAYEHSLELVKNCFNTEQ